MLLVDAVIEVNNCLLILSIAILLRYFFVLSILLKVLILSVFFLIIYSILSPSIHVLEEI